MTTKTIDTAPALRLLSLGAGVQSTTVLLLSARGELPPLDAAIFSDTGWEPPEVYAHLDRIEREIAIPAGIPIKRVRATKGGIRNDALDPTHRFASMPLFVRVPCDTCSGSGEEHVPERMILALGEGDADELVPAYAGVCRKCRGRLWTKGMARRQCTSEYKLKPIKAAVRHLLGYDHPKPVPRGMWAEQWIGISTDEFIRAKDSDVKYARNRFPLIEEGLSRRDCIRILHQHGYETTPKSACVGCPFHGNRQWRYMRDHQPEQWADAVAFDHAIRHGSASANAKGQPLRGEMYLHSSLLPLDEAPIDRVTRGENRAAQLNLLDLAADMEAGVDVDGYDPEVGFEQGCGPWSCRSDGL